jgi:GT2 family glycosyltransferase
MQIGFVFTNYNNSKFTRNLLLSISQNTDYQLSKIVIVDNKSCSEDIESLNNIKKDFPEVKIIFNNDNVGYFPGLNLGLVYLSNNFPDIDHVVIGNNDLFFPNDFINKIINNKFLFQKYPVISPDLISLDGVHQNPHVKLGISKFRNFIYDLYYSNYYISVIMSLFNRLLGPISKRKDYYEFNQAQLISQGYGACYILGPIFFKKFQLLWAPTFLMGEEFFLSKQLEKEGMKVYYEPLFKVNHHDHATMEKLPSKTLWKISKDSHNVYIKYR